MYNEIQIREILESKIAILKKAESQRKMPEFTEVYKDSVEYFERIAVHSEIGKFPDKLFKKRAPNQTDEEFEYLKATYKTTSFPVWERFMGFINRIWNDQNWSITWPEENGVSISENETPESYLQKEYPVYGSLESFFKNVVTPTKERDANALMVHKPYYIPVKTNEENEIVIDEGQRIKPMAYIYGSSQVVGFLDSEYAMVMLKEKSWVQFGNGKEQVGLIFEFYDNENIWRLIQIGKKIDYKFEIILYWNHSLGYVPFMKLKGKPLQRENDILYQSHFMSAVEPMDDILLDSSYLRAIKAGHAFPHKWEYFEECDYNNSESSCINGRVLIDGNETDCPKCHGTGKTRPASPLGVFQVKAPNRVDDSSKEMNIPPFGWVSPDPQIMEFLRKEIEINKSEALSILNLTSSSDPKGSETALEKIVDREDSFSSIQSISNQNFELFDFSHKCNIDMRYGVGIVQHPILSYPKNFAMRNENELTEELANAKEKGLPDIALRKILEEYLNTRFNTQEETTKMVDLAFYADRLISLSTTEIAQKKLSGEIANWEAILHTSIYNFISELIKEDNDFLNKDIEEMKKALIKKSQKKDKEINKPMLDPDKILANASGEIAPPADQEAEAAARLRGSVGGAQVITGFVEKVSQGLMNRDAALEGLKFLFKVDDAQAGLLLGPIKKQPEPQNFNAGS